MKRDSESPFLFLCALSTAICGLLFLSRHGEANANPASTEVTATTWGWAKLVSVPVQVKSPDSTNESTLLQIAFQMTDSETLTAFVSRDFMGMPMSVAASPLSWKASDEVLIVRVPGMGHGHNPTSAYFVIDWRKKPEK